MIPFARKKPETLQTFRTRKAPANAGAFCIIPERLVRSDHANSGSVITRLVANLVAAVVTTAA
jgi:hypothetical protein